MSAIGSLNLFVWIHRNQDILGKASIVLPIAIEATVAVGQLYRNYSKDPEGMVQGLKDRIHQIDKQKVLKIVGVALVVGLAAALFVHTGAMAATVVAVKSLVLPLLPASIWSIALPGETAMFVYPGYLIMGVSSFYQGYKQLTAPEGSRLEAVMHFAMGMIAVATPPVMQMGLYAVRWHHLSYGLLCTLAPSRSVQLFGATMSLESVGYWVHPNPVNFGYDNVFVNNLPAIITTLACCTLWQHLTQSSLSPMTEDLELVTST